MNQKKILSTVFIIVFLVILGYVFNKSKNYNYNHYKKVKIQLSKMIKTIKNQSYQLTDIINQLNINVNHDLIENFKPSLMERRSASIISKLKVMPKNGVETVKRLRESALLVKRSIHSFKAALKELAIRNYKNARTQLKFVKFYLNKAHEKAFKKKGKANFVNPFKRT